MPIHPQQARVMEQPSPDTAPCQVRVQTRGIRILSCECGTVSQFKVHPQQHELECRHCHLIWAISNLIERVPQCAAHKRVPADLSIAYDREELPPPTRAREREELSYRGTVRRNRSTANVVKAERMNELWRDKQDGSLWIACEVGFRTRY